MLAVLYACSYVAIMRYTHALMLCLAKNPFFGNHHLLLNKYCVYYACELCAS